MQEDDAFTDALLKDFAMKPKYGEDDDSFNLGRAAAERTSSQWVSGWYRANYPVPPYQLDSAGRDSRGDAFAQIKAPRSR